MFYSSFFTFSLPGVTIPASCRVLPAPQPCGAWSRLLITTHQLATAIVLSSLFCITSFRRSQCSRSRLDISGCSILYATETLSPLVGSFRNCPVALAYEERRHSYPVSRRLHLHGHWTLDHKYRRIVCIKSQCISLIRCSLRIAGGNRQLAPSAVPSQTQKRIQLITKLTSHFQAMEGVFSGGQTNLE